MKSRVLYGLVAALVLLSSQTAFLQQAFQKAAVAENAPVFLLPDASRTPLRVLLAGTALSIVKVEGDWLQVEFEDQQFGRRVGFIRKERVKPAPSSGSQPPASPAPVPPPPPARASDAQAAAVTAEGSPQAVPPAQDSRPSSQSAATAATTRAEAEPAAAPAPPPRSARPPSASGVPAKLKNLKIHGYVTAVTSPTEFEIEDYRITRDRSFVLDVENASDDLKFRPEDIRVGVELEIKGQFNEATGDLQAKSITVDMEQFKQVKQTAVLSRLPQGIEKQEQGWAGLCFADGQRVRIRPATQVVFGLTRRERDLVKRQQQAKKNDVQNDDEPNLEFQPLASLDQVTLGMLMTYVGRRNPEDGVIEAERIEFAHNDLEKGEKGIRDSLKVESKAFDGTQLRPGELKIKQVGKFKTLPDARVQEYVAAIGRRMIPEYLAEMPSTDANKIDFRFFVVIDKTPNAFATPNGIVVVHSGLFDALENEAQLAFILGHEVSHAVQEHTWRQREYHKKKLMALKIGGAVAAAFGKYSISDMATLVEASVRNGYSRNLENQSDRLGLEYMVNAGYDPRQAPGVWKLMAKKFGDAPTDMFWSSHDNHATRRSYLMNELKNNYAGVDYSALTTGELRYREVAEQAHLAADSKRRIKVK